MDICNTIKPNDVQLSTGSLQKRRLSSGENPNKASSDGPPTTMSYIPSFSPALRDIAPGTETTCPPPSAPSSMLAEQQQPNKMRRISEEGRLGIQSYPLHWIPPSSATSYTIAPPNSLVKPAQTTAVASPDDDTDDVDGAARAPSPHDGDEKPQGLEESDPIVIPDDSDSDMESLFGPPTPPIAADRPPTRPQGEVDAAAPTSLPPAPSAARPGVDTPAGMNCELMPHQRVGVEWLLAQERGENKGSILADDMGLGKTVQAISLMLANPPGEGSGCKTTLIVAPLSLIKQWPREIDSKIKPGHKLKVYIFHGEGKKTSIGRLLSHDVVLTNYETLAAEFKTAETNKRGMILLDPDVKFYRVILDEAHLIKNRKAITSKGAFRLKATYRLALSGTPIMNKPEELYSLVCFLQIPPYNDWDHFNHEIGRALRSEQMKKGTVGAIALRKLRDLGSRIMLVRSKKDLVDDKPIISLPERTDRVEYCDFDQDELTFYNNLEDKTEREVQRYLKASSSGRPNFASILVHLLRLRQACCHPNLLVNYFGDEDDDAAEQGAGASDLDAEFDPDDAGAGQRRKRATRTKGQMQEYYRRLDADYVPSAKARKALELLARIRADAPGEKTIVFSFFTSFLDVLAVALNRAGGFRHRRYDGTMSPAEKDAAVADFMNPGSDTTVLLTSLRSGNAGLNLNLANHVIILEPYWNPFVEMQAIDRAHRIGQTRPVTVYKMLVPNTVEDRIMELQETKKTMVGLALGRGGGARDGLAGVTRDDVLNLLRPNGPTQSGGRA